MISLSFFGEHIPTLATYNSKDTWNPLCLKCISSMNYCRYASRENYGKFVQKPSLQDNYSMHEAG